MDKSAIIAANHALSLVSSALALQSLSATVAKKIAMEISIISYTEQLFAI